MCILNLQYFAAHCLAGYNSMPSNSGSEVVPVLYYDFTELECYCCLQLACTAKLRTKKTEERP